MNKIFYTKIALALTVLGGVAYGAANDESLKILQSSEKSNEHTLVNPMDPMKRPYFGFKEPLQIGKTKIKTAIDISRRGDMPGYAFSCNNDTGVVQGLDSDNFDGKKKEGENSYTNEITMDPRPGNLGLTIELNDGHKRPTAGSEMDKKYRTAQVDPDLKAYYRGKRYEALIFHADGYDHALKLLRIMKIKGYLVSKELCSLFEQYLIKKGEYLTLNQVKQIVGADLDGVNMRW